MRTFLLTLATCAILLVGISVAAEPAETALPTEDLATEELPTEALLIEIAAVDQGFTPVESAVGEPGQDFRFLATNECTTANDCPCPGLCYCVQPQYSYPSTYCLCRTSCCTTPPCP